MPKVGNVPRPRGYCSLVFYNDSLYMYGYIAYTKNIFDDFYRYDLGTETWEQVIAYGFKPFPRKMHYSYVFNDEMFVIYGIFEERFQEYNEIYKFHFLKNTWTKIEMFRGISIIGASHVMIGSKVYFMFGRSLFGISNSIKTIDLSEEVPKLEELTPNFISPSSRYLHFSTVINQYMYMFGGVYKSSQDSLEYFADMWRFDLHSEKWESVLTIGQTPSKRKNSAFCKHGGTRIFLFGGDFEESYFNDLYFFYTPLLTWYKVEPEGRQINERTESCLASFGNYLFIVGGNSINAGNSDIWIYEFENNRLDVFVKNLTSDGLSSVKCWVDEIDENKGDLVIIGGNNYFGVPNSEKIKVSINLLNIKSFNISRYSSGNYSCSVKKNSALLNFQDKIIVLGGYIYESLMISPLIVIDQVTSNCDILDTKNELTLYGHTAVHYKNNIYVFGGGGYMEIYKSNTKFFNNIYKMSFNQTDSIALNCSAGTKSPKCDLCPKGTYFKNGKCELCPIGTFNDELGSTNIDQCMPCPYGTFSPHEGSRYCLYCNEGYECPIGSSSPSNKLASLVNATINPVKYKNEKDYLSNLTSSLWFGFLSFFILLLVISIFSKRTSRLVKRLDMFVKSHDQQLNVPIQYYKTNVGGIFSVSFIMACFVSVALLFMTFQLDNIIEIRGLVPVITLEDSIKANHFQVSFSLHTYGGVCVVDKNCHPDIELSLKHLKYKKMKKQCIKLAGICEVVLTLKDAKLLSKIAEIELQMKEISSFASSLSVNLTVSSSIPDQISSVSSYIQVPSNHEVFKGLKPSTFYYSFTPSVFSSELDKWPSKDTGFHIDTSKDPEIGSTADSLHVNIQLFLKVKIVIEESETAMETSRILRQTWLGFLSTLLGTIFGLMGTFATGMEYFENFFKRIQHRARRNMKISRVLSRENLLKSEFLKWKNRPKDSRIIPLSTYHLPSENKTETLY